jgi:hypothetical protein
LTVPGYEREAFLLWTSSSEKSGKERIATRKEAISMLEKVIESHARDAAYRSLLTSTLRRWKGMAARDQGNWASARFEFLQGRNIAESYDRTNVPWFDAAITEAEVWEAFSVRGLGLDALRELVEKLDRTSGLYGMAGDRSNAESTADWARWFKSFIVPDIPPSDLVSRILDAVLESRSGLEPGEAFTHPPLGDYVFRWNRFWFLNLARETEAALNAVFTAVYPLEVLVRGAAVLAPSGGSLEPLLKRGTTEGGDERPIPESKDRLSEWIRADLDAFRNVEKEAREYVSKVERLWSPSSPQRRKQVEQAMHPKLQRR